MSVELQFRPTNATTLTLGDHRLHVGGVSISAYSHPSRAASRFARRLKLTLHRHQVGGLLITFAAVTWAKLIYHRHEVGGLCGTVLFLLRISAILGIQMQAVEGKVTGKRSSNEMLRRVYEFGDLSEYSFTERLKIRTADLLFYLLIKLIGVTARFDVIGWENHDKAEENGGLPIYVFWHDRIFLTTYWWRNRKIVVLTSRSFDGEYIARFIQRFGYGAIRGSSTRGGVGAVVEMVRLMRAGCTTAFTIDGPKGPRYVAKMGPVLLAKKSGHPIMPVTMALERFWTVPSWDKFQIPKPFTRARIYVAPPIYVQPDADENELNAKRDELQATLDDLNVKTDQWRSSLKGN